jgi:hypothetical protein
VQKRVTWARAYAQSAGMQNVPYLSNDELKVFSDRVKQGPAGQLDATAQLRHAFGGTVAASIVKQIDPEQQRPSAHGRDARSRAQLYKRGVEALTQQDGSPGLERPGRRPGRRASSRGSVRQVSRARSRSTMQGAVRNAARNITAGTAAEFGKSNPTGDELLATFNQAMQRAGGRSGVATDWNAPGGFAEHNGRYVWLPQTMSSNDFPFVALAGPTKRLGSRPADPRPITRAATASAFR